LDQDSRCVFVASGEIQAQQVQAFLASAGIASAPRGEALRNTHGLTVDGLGRVEILVLDDDVERARTLLAAADAGEFRLDDDAVVEFPRKGSADGPDPI
jgi:hypothetical protein